jgi:hypothetical protein
MGAMPTLVISQTHFGAWIGVLFVRAEEAWEPVIFGGMIPILGALAIFFLIWYAVREKPEDDEDEES